MNAINATNDQNFFTTRVISEAPAEVYATYSILTPTNAYTNNNNSTSTSQQYQQQQQSYSQSAVEGRDALISEAAAEQEHYAPHQYFSGVPPHSSSCVGVERLPWWWYFGAIDTFDCNFYDNNYNDVCGWQIQQQQQPSFSAGEPIMSGPNMNCLKEPTDFMPFANSTATELFYNLQQQHQQIVENPSSNSLWSSQAVPMRLESYSQRQNCNFVEHYTVG